MFKRVFLLCIITVLFINLFSTDKRYFQLKGEIEEVPNSIEYELFMRNKKLTKHLIKPTVKPITMLLYSDIRGLKIGIDGVRRRVNEFDGCYMFFIRHNSEYLSVAKDGCGYSSFSLGDLKQSKTYKLELITDKRFINERYDSDFGYGGGGGGDISDCFARQPIKVNALKFEFKRDSNMFPLIKVYESSIEDYPVEYKESKDIFWGKHTFSPRKSKIPSNLHTLILDKQFEDSFVISFKSSPNPEIYRDNALYRNSTLIRGERESNIWIEPEILDQIEGSTVKVEYPQFHAKRIGRTPKTNKYTVPPIAIYTLQPIYAGINFKKGKKPHRVICDVEVFKDGTVGAVEIDNLRRYDDEEYILNTMKKWEFIPAQLNGDATDCWVKIPIMMGTEVW